MMFGYGGGLGGVVAWLWMIGLFVLVVVFIVLLVRGIGGDGGNGGDEAGAILRARLARGEIAPDEYERLRAALGASARTGGGRWWPAVVVAVALAAVLILGGLLGGFGSGFGGPSAPWGGMMGPGMMPGPMMGGWGVASSSGSPVAGDSVGMKGSAFAPPNLLVRVGATITWTNDDALPHTVTAGDRSWSSGDLQRGGTFRRTFAEPGRYPYVCLYHPRMVGTVTVER